MKRALLLALLCSACRDVPELFTPGNPFEKDVSGRLTYNVRPDHAPVWAVDGDSIYYNAATYPGFPTTEGMLLAVPRTGGTATSIMNAVQTGQIRQPWVAGLALSADGGSAAFVEVTNHKLNEFDQLVCPFFPPPAVPQFDTLGTNAFLVGGLLRVRKLNSTNATDDAQLAIQFPGRTYNSSNQLVGITAHPFHRLFDIEGVPFFRPSFSPDGSRVVFSDGLNLRLWTIGQTTSTVIANTADGIMPAWSPDGTLIAFSKPKRGGTQTIGCQGRLNGVVLPLATPTKTIYTPVSREDGSLFVIRPDGTGLRAVGEGDSPAWLSDSKTVVAHRLFALHRINTDTGLGTAIPNTTDGFEAALSRDNKMLSFARRTPFNGNEFIGTYDIWAATF
ncbi:MAG TPA: hypothetical protein VM100_12925 [Longimicrobiales bacterium]|nr:hypothetical protein [Longimicrobiales bacterium]